MRVLITGATGFIGRNLAEGLQADGNSVLATGRNRTIGAELENLGIEFARADLLDGDRLTEAFGPADCVVHCAALAGDWGRYDDFHEANVVGTRNVISACARHDIRRIVFLSTPSLYFNGEHRFDIRESDPLPAVQTTYYSHVCPSDPRSRP